MPNPTTICFPQFFTNSHEIWHRCLPWGVDVQDTFFESGRKCVAMVTAYYGKNWGKILRRELLPQFFTNSHEIWHRCLPWGVDVQDTFFDSGRKCVAMVTAYYGKNWGKILRRELLPQFFTNSHEIWHRCLPLGVDVQDTFFDSGRKCVAMVTAYYTVKKYCGAGVLITFSDISSYYYYHYYYFYLLLLHVLIIIIIIIISSIITIIIVIIIIIFIVMHIASCLSPCIEIMYYIYQQLILQAYDIHR